MEEKKNFFEMLTPKSALLVGIVGGALTLGTIGFIVLGIFTLSNRGSVNGVKAEVAAQTDQPLAQTPPTPAVTKSDKPKIELFVMSYCPYGLQMEKALVPAWELLKNKADISIKFVYYAMHEKKEVDENTRQYCIQSEQADKYTTYLKCFYASGDFQSCLNSTGVNGGKLNNCIASVDKKFGITAKYNDKNSWLSGRFPLYPVDKDLNDKYNVGGSPTLIVNGQEAQVNRSPESLKQVICAAFNNAPAECQQTLSSDSSSAGFGLATTAGSAPAANCGP